MRCKPRADRWRADRTQTFVDMHDVGDMLVHGGFSDPVMDMETLTLTYADPWQALRELKNGFLWRRTLRHPG